MILLADATVRVSLIVLAALALAFVLGRSSAALRHWVLAVGIACAMAMPLLQLALPSWHVSPLSASSLAPSPRADVDTTFVLPGGAVPAVATRQQDARARLPRVGAARVLIGAWLAGVLASLSMLVVGLWRLSRIASAARPLPPGRLAKVASQVATAAGLRRRVTLLQSRDPALLITWGALRPTIVLPARAHTWSDDRARVVLRHELAHAARGDWLAQMLAEVLCALCWFNPLVWIARRRLRFESELACDDAVLAAGVDAGDYAAHLLELARMAMRRAEGPVLAMARSSSLEGRVSAMLNTRINRRPPRSLARLATVAAFLVLTVPLAVAQNRFSTFTGTVMDQTNRFIAGATVVLQNASTQVKYEVRTDGAGHFEIAGLPSGDYQLAVAQPGFKTSKQQMTIAGADLTRTVQLQIGTLQETIHVAGAATDSPASDADRQARLQRSEERAQAARRRASERCSGGPTAGETGGQVLAPLKVTDVRPAYPVSLQSAGIGGVVTLDALIGTDGNVRDATVVSSPDPELGRLAADAVRQWQFTTTYLNCTPVEVPMRVTVSFVSR